MSHPSPRTTAPSAKEFAITRAFDAPRDIVWQAWTDPTRLPEWFGPGGFTVPRCEVDLRPDGELLIVMRAPDGTEIPMTGVFLEIVAPERLVLATRAFEDADGGAQLEALLTVTLEADGGRTTLSVHEAVTTASTPTARAATEGMAEGWNQTLDRLAMHLRTPA